MTDRPMIYRDDAIEAVKSYLTDTGSDLEVWDLDQVLRALAPVQVGVKPLEWRRQSVDCEVAETVLGNAAVQNESHALKPNRWGWWMVGSGEDDSPTGYEDDLEAAKAAAQADYEARIRSAMIETPVDAAHIRAEALREAKAYIQTYADSARNADEFAREAAFDLCIETIDSLIATPAPSPDVGALAVPRYSGYEIMWAQDGHVPEPQADGEWVLYSDMVAALIGGE